MLLYIILASCECKYAVSACLEIYFPRSSDGVHEFPASNRHFPREAPTPSNMAGEYARQSTLDVFIVVYTMFMANTRLQHTLVELLSPIPVVKSNQCSIL